MKSLHMALLCAVFAFVQFPLLAEDYFGKTTNSKGRSMTSHGNLVANYILTVADDFVVDVYHNGQRVPQTDRKIISETFGATAEKISIPVHKGDWLVFNVVNNRLRWGGASYFAVAGMLDDDEVSFVSKLGSPRWTACDEPSLVDAFISKRSNPHEAPVSQISKLWRDGDKIVQKLVGSSWDGDPIWGSSSNTWIKVRIDD